MNRLALVIPIYNYASHLPVSLAKLRSWKIQQVSATIDIIFCDDGSTDETAAVLKKWIAEQGSGWHFISSPENTGKGATVRRGLTKARELKPDFVAFCDCDLHYGLTIIFDRMIPTLASADIAIVDRSWKTARVEASPVRRFASALFNRSVAILTGVAFRDTQAGLKAFRYESCRPIFELLTIDGFAFDVELLSIALFYRLRVKQIPIQLTHLAETSRVSLLNSSLRMLIDLIRINLKWKTGRYHHPVLQGRIEAEIYTIKDY